MVCSCEPHSIYWKSQGLRCLLRGILRMTGWVEKSSCLGPPSHIFPSQHDAYCKSPFQSCAQLLSTEYLKSNAFCMSACCRVISYHSFFLKVTCMWKCQCMWKENPTNSHRSFVFLRQWFEIVNNCVFSTKVQWMFNVRVLKLLRSIGFISFSYTVPKEPHFPRFYSLLEMLFH